MDNDINNDFNKDITAIAFNTLTPSGNFFYNDYGVKYFMTLNRPILIKTAKNIVTSINNNAFIYGLTSNIELGGTEPSTVRSNDKENLTIDIDFLNCYFNDG